MLEKVTLEPGAVLRELGAPAEEVYFPTSSLISTVSRMENGAAVEVGLAGREGLSPLSVAFGERIGPHDAVVQIPGSSWCVGATAFLQLLDTDADLRRCTARFAQYAFVAAAQFAACNRLHSLEARYARWLLMASDRVGSHEFVLTQEYTSQMLGVRRAGVTTAAGEMANAGLITYRRGRVAVVDRAGLEETSCECYGVVNAELWRLMGYDVNLAERPSAA